MPDYPPLVLVVLDGFGEARPSMANAITVAKRPTLESLRKRSPATLLTASGSDVGLPAGQVGNSEAGHLNIGGGRIVVQDAVRITRAITDGTFFKNPALLEAVEHAMRKRHKLHIMGLVSAHQSAHADPDHLLALLTLVRMKRVPRVFLHLFTDGRDANQRAGLRLIDRFAAVLPKNAHIASVIGRHYAMERKKVWKYCEQAYDCLTRGAGAVATDAVSAMRTAYDRGETDEFVLPTVIEPFLKTGRISDGDSVIFFNLRSDRARQLTKAFIQPHFNAKNPGSFRRRVVAHRLKFIAMTDFGPDLGPMLTAFPSEDVRNSLPIALTGLKQVYIAETEKYAHMTYFFNGGFDHPVAGEDRFVIPSPNVAQYDAVPEMSAPKITDAVLGFLRARTYDFYGINYANADMLGHTGNFLATVKAIEVIDTQLARLAPAVLERNGTLVVTADHGNAEQMLKANGEVDTEHSNNPVPFIVSRAQPDTRRLKRGRLGDIAPTLLAHLGLQKPALMTGESLWI